MKSYPEPTVGATILNAEGEVLICKSLLFRLRDNFRTNNTEIVRNY